MKRSDFVRLMGNIDEKYLKEADNYSARPRNWVRVTAVAACIAVLVTAIPLTLILNRGNKNAEDLPTITTEDNKIIDDTPGSQSPTIIYCSSSIKEQLIAKYSGKNVEIRDSSEIEVSDEEHEVDFSQFENIPAKLFFTVEDHDFVCSFSGKVYSRWESNSKPNIYIAEYQIDQIDAKEVSLSKCSISYNLTSREIFIIDLSCWNGNDESKEDIDKNTAKIISDQIMVDLFGSDIWNLYQYEKTSEPQRFGASEYVITYRVHIKGYIASQCIFVRLDPQGNLKSVDTGDPTRMDILNDLKADDIKNASEAIDAVYESVCEGKTIINKRITVQGNDKAYWRIRYEDLDEFGEYTVNELFYPIG